MRKSRETSELARRDPLLSTPVAINDRRQHKFGCLSVDDHHAEEEPQSPKQEEERARGRREGEA